MHVAWCNGCAPLLLATAPRWYLRVRHPSLCPSPRSSHVLRRTTTRTAIAATAAAIAMAALSGCGAGGPEKADASTLKAAVADPAAAASPAAAPPVKANGTTDVAPLSTRLRPDVLVT